MVGTKVLLHIGDGREKLLEGDFGKASFIDAHCGLAPQVRGQIEQREGIQHLFQRVGIQGVRSCFTRRAPRAGADTGAGADGANAFQPIPFHLFDQQGQVAVVGHQVEPCDERIIGIGVLGTRVRQRIMFKQRANTMGRSG